MTDLVREQLVASFSVLQAVAEDTALHATLAEAAERTAAALAAGRKLMIAGNGGSAGDAQHLAAEFISRLCEDRPPMRAMALTTDTSILTAIGNDYGFDRVFERQIEGVGQAGDVFLGISTSGRSPNVLHALELCREMGIVTIGMTGKQAVRMPPLCDYCIKIPSDVTMHIQEAHLALEHVFCMLVERKYFRAERPAEMETTAVLEE